MGYPRVLGVALILSFLLLNLLQFPNSVVATGAGTVEVQSIGVTPAGAPAPANIDCGKECDRRCSKTSRRDKCERACLSCCHTCACVPPGTAGNKEACPCYANLLNPKNGVHKCP